MKSKVTETIFSSKSIIIPMAQVQHIEKVMKADKLEGITIITDKTKWSFEFDTWENSIWISNYDNQAQEFLNAFCNYISERDGMQEVEDE